MKTTSIGCVSGRGFTGLLIVASMALVFVLPVRVRAESVAEKIEQSFEELDKELASVAGRPEMQSMKQARTVLRGLFKDHAELHTVMQTNSKGKVINEIVRTGSPGRRYRSVARQSWFREVAKQKPYHGYLEFRRRGYYLFWCYPVERKSGGFGGAVVTKIDLDKALKAVADEVDKPFLVTVEGEKVYAHAWKESIDAEAVPLQVRGLEGLKVQAEPVKAAAKPAADTAAPAAATKAAAEEAKEEEPSTRTGNPWPVVIAVVVLAVIGGAIGKVVHGMTQKRHERLMRSIEGDEDVAEPPAPSAAPSYPQQQSPPPAQAQFQPEEVGSFSYDEPGGEPAPRQQEEDAYFENNATVVMPRSQVPGASDSGSRNDYPAGYGGGESYPQQAAGADPRASGRDQELYRQMRAELEQQFQQELTRRTEQIRQELYAQAREALAKSVGQYSAALVRHVEELKGLAPNEPARQDSLNSISAELRRLSGKLQGGGTASN